MGLLDYLNTDDVRLGIGLLAAGGPTTDPNRSGFGQRLAGALQGVQAQQDGDLRAQLLKSQITENASQDAMRRQQLAMAQRKQAMQEGLLGYGSNPGVSGATSTPGLIASAPTGGAPAAPGAGMGAPSAAASPGTPVQTPRGPMTLQQLSQTYQIPYESLAFDLVNNDGKGISDMIFKRGAPDMQVQNGYAYDKNKLGAGYLPQLNISSNGQATQVQIGPDGQPVVSAPQGAVGTYGAYQGAANRSAADYQPEKVIDPGTGRMVVQPRSNVLQPPVRPLIGPGVTSPGLAGGSSGAAAVGQVQILAQELPKAQAELQAAQQRGDQAGAMRAQQDIEGLTRELQRLPGGAQVLGGGGQSSAFAPSPLIGPGAGRGAVQPVQGAPSPLIGPGAGRGVTQPTAGNVVELSPAEQAANAAQKETATSLASKTGEMMQASAEKATAAVQAVGTAQRLQQAIDSNKAFTGMGAGLRMQAAQLATTLGMPGKDDAERIANTRIAMQEMAKLTLDGRRQMSGQGAITDRESALAERASSGDISGLTPAEIKILANAAERSARFQYQQHDNKLNALGGDAVAAPQLGIYRADPLPPPLGTKQAPALPTGWTVKVK